MLPARTNASGNTVSVGFGAALGLNCYCDVYSFNGFSGLSSYAYDATDISKNGVTLLATLAGSTNQAVNCVPAAFPAYGRTWA